MVDASRCFIQPFFISNFSFIPGAIVLCVIYSLSCILSFRELYFQFQAQISIEHIRAYVGFPSFFSTSRFYCPNAPLYLVSFHHVAIKISSARRRASQFPFESPKTFYPIPWIFCANLHFPFLPFSTKQISLTIKCENSPFVLMNDITIMTFFYQYIINKIITISKVSKHFFKKITTGCTIKFP